MGDVTVSKVTSESPPFGVVADPNAPQQPAPRSPLAALKVRREELAKGLHLDLKVPRWEDPEIFVRYAPIDSTKMEESIAKRSQGGKGWSILANADVLAQSCQGVYACLDGDYTKKFSLKAPEVAGVDASEDALLRVAWTRFDQDLREALGVHAATHNDAVSVCRALYLTDGDLIAAATALMEWSGISAEKLDEDFTKP